MPLARFWRRCANRLVAPRASSHRMATAACVGDGAKAEVLSGVNAAALRHASACAHAWQTPTHRIDVRLMPRSNVLGHLTHVVMGMCLIVLLRLPFQHRPFVRVLRQTPSRALDLRSQLHLRAPRRTTRRTPRHSCCCRPLRKRWRGGLTGVFSILTGFDLDSVRLFLRPCPCDSPSSMRRRRGVL